MSPNSENKNIIAQTIDSTREYIHDATKSRQEKQAEEDAQKTLKQNIREAVPDNKTAGAKFGEALDHAAEDFQAVMNGESISRYEREPEKYEPSNPVSSALESAREKIYDATKSKEEKEWENKTNGDRVRTAIVDGVKGIDQSIDNAVVATADTLESIKKTIDGKIEAIENEYEKDMDILKHGEKEPSMIEKARDFVYDKTKSQEEIEKDKSLTQKVKDWFPDTTEEAGARLGHQVDKGVDSVKHVVKDSEEAEEQDKKPSITDKIHDIKDATREKIHEAFKSPERREYEQTTEGEAIRNTIIKATAEVGNVLDQKIEKGADNALDFKKEFDNTLQKLKEEDNGAPPAAAQL